MLNVVLYLSHKALWNNAAVADFLVQSLAPPEISLSFGPLHNFLPEHESGSLTYQWQLLSIRLPEDGNEVDLEYAHPPINSKDLTRLE